MLLVMLTRFFTTAPTEAITNNISKSTLHTILRIDTQKIKRLVQGQSNSEKCLYDKTTIIIDKMSMVNLDFLVTVNLYPGRTKSLYKICLW